MSLYQMMTKPLGLPELGQLFFSDDRILLVPDAFYAAEHDVLLDITGIFLEHGAEPPQITLLFTDADTGADSLRQRLPAGAGIHIHQPGKESELARLGVNDKDEPVMLNRTLIDADLILTIGKFAAVPGKNDFGIHSAVFPRFSGLETVQRFQASRVAKRKLKEEADQAASMLGIIFTVQFLHRKDKTTRIAAGLPHLVENFLRAYG
ncbi:MAG: hypothetical protein LBH00_11365 [Planctomycetaceae bacterium]|jgi:hypothetical protein|nr:hypothetical protein [Planctomycetaceae bacterium]